MSFAGLPARTANRSWDSVVVSLLVVLRLLMPQ